MAISVNGNVKHLVTGQNRDSKGITPPAADSTLPSEAQSFVLTAYRNYRTELERFLSRSYILDGAEIEDLIQSAFEKFATSPHLLSIENPRAFLYKLVNNLALNHFRHVNVKQRYENESNHESQESDAPAEVNPENIAQHHQQLEAISDCLLNMPEKRRQIVMMNRFEHLSYAEIGRRLGISEAAVRKHIKRALHDIMMGEENE